ncbi:hypothetical protein J3R83DRAFT_8004 [Lanmaoa asiatica]|nr:hypothetical protein J3R83DRAFT_8004 [Lanmaoa asiatica]
MDYNSESSQPIFASEDVQIVITHIRAENVAVGLGRIPIGFYVQFDFDGSTPRRTKIKPVPVCDSVIQWDDPIQMPSDPSVVLRVAIYASFEFSPVLGRGEPLRIVETSVGSLLNRTDPITFSEREGGATSPCSSLLIVVQQWDHNHQTCTASQVQYSLDWEDSSELAKETELGHDALDRYHRDHCKEDLESCIAHFKRALDTCPDAHTCRAAALSNLATVALIMYQFYGTSPSFDRAIALYREALKLRCDGHPDRPTTLLRLSQVLLCHHGVTGYHVPIEAELRKLVNKVMDICPRDSHERRAANLVLQTSERFRLRDSDDLGELDKLISILDVAAQEPPETYFDRPIRFNNLGLALLKRFALCCDPNDLDRAIMWFEKTLKHIERCVQEILAHCAHFVDNNEIIIEDSSPGQGVMLLSTICGGFIQHLLQFTMQLDQYVHWSSTWTFQEWVLANDLEIAIEGGSATETAPMGDYAEIKLGTGMTRGMIIPLINAVKAAFPNEDLFLSYDEIDAEQRLFQINSPHFGLDQVLGVRSLPSPVDDEDSSETAPPTLRPRQDSFSRLQTRLILLSSFAARKREATYEADLVASRASMCNIPYTYDRHDDFAHALSKVTKALRAQGLCMYDFLPDTEHSQLNATNQAEFPGAPMFTGRADTITHLTNSLRKISLPTR